MGTRDALVVLLLASQVTFLTAKQHTVCAIANEDTEVVFDCGGELISEVQFGSFGTPHGSCDNVGGGNFQVERTCHAPQTTALLEERCLGQATCIFQATAENFGGKPTCPASAGSKRWLASVLVCGNTPNDRKPPQLQLPKQEFKIHLGWTVVLLICLAFAAYCGLGIHFNIQRNGAKGLETIPHLELWKDLPSLVWEGIIFTIDTLKSRGRGQYEGVL